MRREYEFRVYQQLGELYIKQERVKDAADTFGAFAQRSPSHPEAPVLQARVIDIYAAGGFPTQALDAKKQYVTHYGVDSEYQRSNPEGWTRNAEPLVKTHLEELARYHHASAQKTKKTEDYQEAVRWYRSYLDLVPAGSAGRAEQLPAGRAAVRGLALFRGCRRVREVGLRLPAARQERRRRLRGAAGLRAAGEAAARDRRAEGSTHRVDSALRFAKAFPQDPRSAPVLTNAAEKLYALNDGAQAAVVAHQVLALQPPAAAEQRRVAWTVVAHTSFEKGAFVDAERAYGEVLALTPDKDASRDALTERLAASVYKQGEAARAQGQLPEAIGHYTRVATVAPASPVRATAQYDAAAAMLALEGLGRCGAHARGFPQPLSEASAAERGDQPSLRSPTWKRAAGRRLQASSRSLPPPTRTRSSRVPDCGRRPRCTRRPVRARPLRAPTSATSSSTPSRSNLRWRPAIDWRGSRARTAIRRANWH